MSGDEDIPTTPSTDGEALATPGSPEVTPTSTNKEATIRKPRTLPQSDWRFAFGPEKWYWVRIGDAWRFVWSNNSDWNDIGIREPSWVAYKHTTGFLIGGDDEDGEPKIVHN
ncbi:uncharacterized protein N0V89_004817 [Didymosphaeria variabile]|uniref:Uncharacterized protein n=1 Tax=Didymosphaeria variabile TaxID=1932322 RepID=A0A9W8XSJ1_9PLEO|nr:uncharacterized protein N0V89_004817 [Didymosphaeria variabile]KAJ4356781.1 hypothetical protein N0V89_004817 [Didymosphaeria variabile]